MLPFCFLSWRYREKVAGEMKRELEKEEKGEIEQWKSRHAKNRDNNNVFPIQVNLIVLNLIHPSVEYLLNQPFTV